MKKKILVLSLLSLFLLIPASNVAGFNHVDNINEGISVYFLAHLKSTEYFEVNVTHIGDGNFTLFLFDSRPIESFVKTDKSLDSHIFDLAINYSIDDNPYIIHLINESRIYYIQLILVDNGPDTFFLYCNKELTRYYLPLIPGYSIGVIFLSLLLTISFIMIVKKRIYISINE
jgi:hypothetical protein